MQKSHKYIQPSRSGYSGRKDINMRKFEIGKIYEINSEVYKIIKRTKKFVTVEKYHHYDRYNERLVESRRIKIQDDWIEREVFFWGSTTIEA